MEKELNFIAAKAISNYVKLCLLQNKVYMENKGTERISTKEVMSELENIKAQSDLYGYFPNDDYRKLRTKCAGSIDFTDDEIDEIASIVERAINVCGIERGKTYLDVITFAARSLERLEKYRPSIMEGAVLTADDYQLARKWKNCLILEQTSLYYKPFACIISSGYPTTALKITNDENKVVFDLDNSSDIRVNELTKDIFLSDMFSSSFEKTEDKAVDAAVNWWVQALSNPLFALRYYSSPSFMSVALTIAMNMHTAPPTEEEMLKFREYLTDEISTGLRENGTHSIHISANYEMDPTLNTAMQKAHIYDTNFSWETQMDISPEQVSIALGGNSNGRVVLYDAKEDTKSNAIQKVKTGKR